MASVDNMLDRIREKYGKSGTTEVYTEQLQGWFDLIDELRKENKELKKQIAEYDDLTEELDYRKREAKRLGWNAKDSVSTITKIIDGPITYRKDSTGKWVADGEPPIVLC